MTAGSPIDRAGLIRQALEEAVVVIDAEDNPTSWNLVNAALRILRTPTDAKGEAGFVPVDENTPEGWNVTWREGEIGWTLACLQRVPEEHGGGVVWSAPSGHDTIANAGSYAAPTHYLPGGYGIGRLTVRERHPLAAPQPAPEAGKLPSEEANAYERCARLCEDRAAYHDEGIRRGARHYDREDAARSYRATADKIRKMARALLSAPPHDAPAHAPQDTEEAGR